MLKTFVVAVGVLASVPASARLDEWSYVEKDGDARILYRVACGQSRASGKIENFCSVKVVQASASTKRCTLTAETLFGFEPARYTNGTYTVTLSAGICKYTNTYTFSATGMTQTKTSPAKKAVEICEVFPPKTYTASIEPSSGFDMKTKGCSELVVSAFGLN